MKQEELGKQNNNENMNYEEKFKNVFDYSPISLWEEDLSELYEGLEKIRAEGISDLKSFLLSNTDIVESFTQKIKILNVNNATLKLFEADSIEELIGGFNKLFDIANIDIFISELLAIWNKEDSFTAEYRSFSIKGTPIYTHFQFKIPKNPSEFKNVIISIIDLTELINVEKKLLAEQELYRTIFTLAPNGILIEDKNGNILDANEAQHISLGYATGELIGKDIRNIASIENKFLIEENISKVLNGEILIHELESLKKDGTRCINALRETRIPLPNGEFGILSISTDVTEKRKIEKALRKREEIFTSLFNLSSDMLIVINPSSEGISTIVYVNDTSVQQYGYTREELIGKPISIYVKKKDGISTKIKKVMAGEIISFESEHICKDGTTFPVEVNAKLITLFGKNYIYSIARDISAVKEEKKKQEQKIKFLNASNNISEIILFEDKVYNLLSNVINVIGETLGVDRAFIYYVNLKKGKAEMLTVWNNPQAKGLSPAENIYSTELFENIVEFLLANKNIIESYFDEVHPAFTGEPASILHHKLKSKTLLWLPFSFSADNFLLLTLNQIQYKRVFNEAEKEFIRSVTQQINLAIMKIGLLNKQHTDEAELKKLSQAVQQSPAEVIITDVEGNIEYVNAKFTETTGYAASEVKGKNPRILKSGHMSEKEYKNLWDTIITGNTWTGELHNKKKNGELFWESAVISSIKNEKGEIQHYLGIKEIITEKKLLLEELKQSKIKIERGSKLKSTFLSQMSHEIRTPINTMISFASLIKDDLEDRISPDLSRSFEGIERAGKRIIRTTELLLSLAEIQTNTYEPNFKMIDLNIEILAPLALGYKNQAVERKLKFEYKIKFEEAVVRGDLSSLEKIFRNLIENAIKFTKTGLIKLLVFKNDENKVVVEVSDTGIGISEEFIPNLYDAFSQEDTGYSRRYDGNGIGLALVGEYCKLNNIKIDVKSKPGEGATFTLTFLSD